MFRLTVFVSCLALALALPNRVPRLDGRIVGGKDADIRDYPYQVSLRSSGYHICGGSIIDSKHVVTAAHCTDGAYPESLSIRAGSSDYYSGGQIIAVERFDQNPGFNFGTLDFDVTVLTLASELEFGEGVQPIELGSGEPQGGADAICTGWGALSSGGGDPDTLQSVTVQVVDRAECRRHYSTSEISDNMICAGADGKDSCQGDSGGPLASGGKLIGIVSWGYGCADPRYPGVYSNVNALSGFIKDHTRL